MPSIAVHSSQTRIFWASPFWMAWSASTVDSELRQEEEGRGRRERDVEQVLGERALPREAPVLVQQVRRDEGTEEQALRTQEAPHGDLVVGPGMWCSGVVTAATMAPCPSVTRSPGSSSQPTRPQTARNPPTMNHSQWLMNP